MPVHLTPWSCPGDYHDWFAVSAPYHADFVSGLKDNVPGYARKWLPEVKIWVVRFDFKEELDIVLDHYFKRELCSFCFAKEVCLVWRRSKLLDFGRPEPWKKPSTAPPPPRPAPSTSTYKSPEQLAAELLGLRPPFGIDEIKTAFKRKALDAHPDRGGSHEAFLQVRSAAERLLKAQGARL